MSNLKKVEWYSDDRDNLREGEAPADSSAQVASADIIHAAHPLEPDVSAAAIASGYEHLRLGWILSAREKFESVLERDRNNKAALLGLGHTFRHLKQLENAEAQFGRLLALDPKHTDGLKGLAATLKSEGRLEDALAALRSIDQTSTPLLAVKQEIADLLRDLDRTADALETLRELVALEPDNATNLIRLARLSLIASDLDVAIDAFRSAISIDPKNLNVAIELGHALRQAGQLDEAERLLNRVITENSDNISALHCLAYVLWKAGRTDEAIEKFGQILKIDHTNIPALHAVGMISRQRGDHAHAVTFFTRVAEIDPSRIDARLEVARSLHRRGQYDDAIIEFQRIADGGPGSTSAWIGIGQAKRALNDFAGAVAAFDAALLEDPSCVNAPTEAGHIYLYLKEPKEAERQFRKALEIAPDNGAALSGLSYALRRLNRLDEAEAALKQVIAANPGDHSAVAALVGLLESQHRTADAIDQLKRTADLGAASAAQLIMLAKLYRQRGDHKNSAHYFKRAAAADPGQVTEVAAGLRELGYPDDAEQMIGEWIGQHADDEKALNERGIQLRSQGRHEEARDVFEKVKHINPDNARNLVELATEERALGQLQIAKNLLQEALELEPSLLGALLQLGELSALNGDVEYAQKFFQLAQDEHPDNIWPWLKSIWTSFDAGETDEAFALIGRARDSFPSNPELEAVEVDLLRKQRDLLGARAVLHRADRAGISSFWLSVHRVQIEISTAHDDKAKALLDELHATGASEFSRVALLRGQLAEAQYDYPAARAHYEEAIRLTPSDGWAHMDLARACLMAMDVEAARSELGRFVECSKAYLVAKGKSTNITQNHVGQLLEDFELDRSILAQLQHASTLPAAEQLPVLRSIVRLNPDCMPAAIATTIALRKSGWLSSKVPVTVGGPFIESGRPFEGILGSQIPSQIVQFWDRDPPEDVVDLMTSWQELNPQYSWACFDDEKARRFIHETFQPDVLQAYSRARQPAQKADLFRLAYLAARGGVYADADDRCETPLSNILRNDATLVVHQDNYASIGNNFIAAPAKHPVLQRALDMVVAALNRGDQDLIWLSTGPGLLTRAFAMEWANADEPNWLASAQVLTLAELQRVVGVHCPVRYKMTDKHWTRKSFARQRARRSTDAPAMSSLNA